MFSKGNIPGCPPLSVGLEIPPSKKKIAEDLESFLYNIWMGLNVVIATVIMPLSYYYHRYHHHNGYHYYSSDSMNKHN